MNEKDIRIGNSLLLYDEVVKVTEIGFKNDDYYLRVEGNKNGYYLDQFEPIKLTEEILLKCGFKENKFSHVYEDDTRVSVYVNDDFFFCQIDNVVINNIKHLHQLQNLYFALTGKELEIEL